MNVWGRQLARLPYCSGFRYAQRWPAASGGAVFDERFLNFRPTARGACPHIFALPPRKRTTMTATTNPFDSGYFLADELRSFGFKSVGQNVKIAKNCTIIGLENIELGNNVRIDGYCTIAAAGSGFVRIGSYVHIGAYSFLAAGEGIVMEDFSGISQGVRIYSRTDDYTGKYLSNPTVPAKYTGVTGGTVTLRKHALIGSGAIILPKIEIGLGSAVGAMSLVTKSLPEWGFYFGVPAKLLKARSQRILELEQQLLAEGG
jgi:galactoside O-acetyltransferase